MVIESAPQQPDEAALRQSAARDFAVVRANALNEYAIFESHLALLFEVLLGAEPRRAFAVFASVMNARARMRMIQRLLSLSHEEKYNTFFNSVSNISEGLEKRRNRTAHWMAVSSHTGGVKFDKEKHMYLSEHPDVFSDRKFYRHEIKSLRKEVRFIGFLIFYFAIFLRHPGGKIENFSESWSTVFSEKVVYPPPVGHPLNRSRKKK